jgi:hypothetical protein
MAAPSKTRTDWQWPADVVALATEQNMQAYLDPLLAATWQIFPTADWVKVSVVQDPEIRDFRQIVFRVRCRAGEVSETLNLMRQWNEAQSRVCPPPYTLLFVLDLDLHA